MAVLLDVFASPRKKASRTRQLRDAFVEAWLASHPGGQVLSVDLPEQDSAALPEFDEWDVEAKYQVLYGQGELDEGMAQRWNALKRFTDQLHLADVLLVSTPMWNFGIPWTLKRWIDIVAQPQLTFEYRDGGFHGLLRGRTGVLLCTRDGAYGPSSPFAKMDFQVPYLKFLFGFLGIDPIHTVVAEGLSLHGPEVAAAAMDKARREALAIARSI